MKNEANHFRTKLLSLFRQINPLITIEEKKYKNTMDLHKSNSKLIIVSKGKIPQLEKEVPSTESYFNKKTA